MELLNKFVNNSSIDSILPYISSDSLHYTMVKSNMFNGINHPSIGIWTKYKKFQLIRKFDYHDYKSNLS